VNERAAQIATPGAPGVFLCECSRGDCAETLELPPGVYEIVRSSLNLFVIAPGHECLEVDLVIEARATFTLVEKTKHLELVLSWPASTPGKGVSTHEYRK
jgi:hypothetical protein